MANNKYSWTPSGIANAFGSSVQQFASLPGDVGNWLSGLFSGGSSSAPANSNANVVYGGGTQQPNSAPAGGQPVNTQPTTNTVPGSDYYSQALSLLGVPSGTSPIGAETSALTAQENLIPQEIAAQKTSLQDQQTALQNVYSNIINQINQQSQQAGQQITSQAGATIGQARSTAAKEGISSTSGVEQSQEANIGSQAATKLQQLDENTADQTSTLGAQEAGQIQQITDQINALPTEQQQQTLAIGTQIAEIIGQGAGAALNYAGQMASLAASVGEKNATMILSGLATLLSQNPTRTVSSPQWQNMFGGKTSTTGPASSSANTAAQNDLISVLQNLGMGGGTNANAKQ